MHTSHILHLGWTCQMPAVWCVCKITTGKGMHVALFWIHLWTFQWHGMSVLQCFMPVEGWCPHNSYRMVQQFLLCSLYSHISLTFLFLRSKEPSLSTSFVPEVLRQISKITNKLNKLKKGKKEKENRKIQRKWKSYKRFNNLWLAIWNHSMKRLDSLWIW